MPKVNSLVLRSYTFLRLTEARRFVSVYSLLQYECLYFAPYFAVPYLSLLVFAHLMAEKAI